MTAPCTSEAQLLFLLLLFTRVRFVLLSSIKNNKKNTRTKIHSKKQQPDVALLSPAAFVHCDKTSSGCVGGVVLTCWRQMVLSAKILYETIQTYSGILCLSKG